MAIKSNRRYIKLLVRNNNNSRTPIHSAVVLKIPSTRLLKSALTRTSHPLCRHKCQLIAPINRSLVALIHPRCSHLTPEKKKQNWPPFICNNIYRNVYASTNVCNAQRMDLMANLTHKHELQLHTTSTQLISRESYWSTEMHHCAPLAVQSELGPNIFTYKISRRTHTQLSATPR